MAWRKPCPTPRKRRYRDEIAAKLAASSGAAGWRRGNGSSDTPGTDEMEAYQCPCGRWHVRTIRKRGSG